MNTRLRRTAATLAAGLLVAGLVDATLPASSVAADPPITLKVVGTSDVSDSGLLKGQGGYLHDKILAATNINVDYTGTATGTALAAAKNGTASALIVHAASLENQFVDTNDGLPGYSFESAGRSLMWGDYILAGYTGDKAGAAGVAAHDVVAGFNKIARAGQAGNAHFFDRKNTSGTTVQEHAIWKLVHDNFDTANQIPMCIVSDANGGGMSPIDAASGTAPAACSATPTFPAWYVAVDRNQAANVTAANVCTEQGSNNDCYVFTDRGTLQYLKTLTPNTADKLDVITRNNAATAPGGFEALINAFHIYVVNPAGVTAHGQNGNQVDTATAVRFLDYMTSPAGQAAIGGYLSDPPFLPAAAPAVTVSQNVPGSITGGGSVTVQGSLANKIPGYAKLDGMAVSLQAVPSANPSAAPATVASSVTNAAGGFSLSYTPSASMTYALSVPATKRLQIDTLSPKFYDLLQGVTTTLGVTNVNGGLAAPKRKVQGRKLKVSGTLSPQVTGGGATLSLYRAKIGKKHKLKLVKSKPLAAGATSYSTKFKFPKGTWKYVIVYDNPGVITSVATKQYKVRVR